MIPELTTEKGPPKIQEGILTDYDIHQGWMFPFRYQELPQHFKDANNDLMRLLSLDYKWQPVAFRKYDQDRDKKCFDFVYYSEQPLAQIYNGGVRTELNRVLKNAPSGSSGAMNHWIETQEIGIYRPFYSDKWPVSEYFVDGICLNIFDRYRGDQDALIYHSADPNRVKFRVILKPYSAEIRNRLLDLHQQRRQIMDELGKIDQIFDRTQNLEPHY